MKDKLDSTFDNVKADILAGMDSDFVSGNFCSVIRKSTWPA